VALYTLLVFTTTLVRSPYCPKYSGAFKISSYAISGAIPITYTSVFWITRRFSNFFIFSFDNVLICILLVPFGGINPKLFKFLTQLLYQYSRLITVQYLQMYIFFIFVHGGYYFLIIGFEFIHRIYINIEKLTCRR